MGQFDLVAYDADRFVRRHTSSALTRHSDAGYARPCSNSALRSSRRATRTRRAEGSPTDHSYGAEEESPTVIRRIAAGSL
jgi:hypothetical protein